MKLVAYLFFSVLVLNSHAQSELSSPNSDCKFTLPWNCETCSFHWSGNCINHLPEGEGILTVTNEGNEIMRYEGGMKNGRFEGEGKYRDQMNMLEGKFKNGSFLGGNPFISQRNARLDSTRFNRSSGWEEKKTVTRQIDNFYFTFPAEGYAYKNRDRLVEKCLKAFDQNCALIGDPDYTEFTRIRFVSSKNEVLLHANLYVSAMADINSQSIYMTVSDVGPENERLTKPPIVHETMHLVAMTHWGPPPQNNNWLNEGLATYAQNSCSGFSVAEIYRFFMENEMLAPLDVLSNSFYDVPEMVSYHQSAYIVEYLITQHGIANFEAFWKGGFKSLESVYGFNHQQLLKNVNAQVLKSHPQLASIDWEVLKEGCK